ncbi:MAG: hypothetical protein GX160_10750 [Clostridiales bacterium]|jgi:flagellar motility protein MotE (MotC chaperone)|nr:hypothetical protein [Clostridiales bacterium]
MAKNKKGKIGLIIFIIAIFVLIFAALAFVFDIGGMKKVAYSIIGKDLGRQTMTGMTAIEIELKKEEEYIEAEKTKLSALRTDLENYKTELDNRAKELDEREMLLKEKEQDIERLKETLSGQFQDLMEIVKIYENMNGDEAAAILSQMEDTEKVILILKNLKKEKSAEILGLMNPEDAAKIVDGLLEAGSMEGGV